MVTPDQPTKTESTSRPTNTSTTQEETPEPTSVNPSGGTEEDIITERSTPKCKLPSFYDFTTGKCERNPGSYSEEEIEQQNAAEDKFNDVQTDDDESDS